MFGDKGGSVTALPLFIFLINRLLNLALAKSWLLAYYFFLVDQL